MKGQNNTYYEIEEYLKEEEKKLNQIYKELLKNNQDKKTINKFDRIIKSKLDYKGIIPCSKSYEGESLLTLSKTWMIIILIKITKGRVQQDQFLTLVNSSLTHELNEYEEYKEFYEDQCEILFSSEEAIRQINLNPNLSTKIDSSIKPDELRNYYIYLLYKPQYFKAIELDGISKNKKKDLKNKNISKVNKSRSSRSKSRKSNSSIIEILSDSEENDEKGDRLDEKDMISKDRVKKSLNGGKKKKSSNKKKNNKNYKEDDNSDYAIIDDIINKRNTSNKREDKTKKAKTNNKNLKTYYLNDEDSVIEISDISENEEKTKKNKNKKKSNNKKNDKKKKDSDEEEEKSLKKDNKKKEKKNKNERSEGQKKSNKKSNRSSIDRIYDLLEIDKNLIKDSESEEEENKKKTKAKTKIKGKRNTISVPPKRNKDKDKPLLKKNESSNKKEKPQKKENKTEKKKINSKKTKKTKKAKKSKTDDEDSFFGEKDSIFDDESLEDLSNLNLTEESDKYGDNLDNYDINEKKKMEDEIKAAMRGDIDAIDLEGILEESKLEGISINQLESELKSSSSSKELSDMDLNDEESY